METSLPTEVALTQHFKPLHFLIFAVIIILAGVLYYYFNSSLHFKSLGTLQYDKQVATQILKDPTSLVFTRNGALYIGTFSGAELVLAPSVEQFGQKEASFRISKSKNYITWESDMGLVGLDVAKRNVFLIYSGEPRQSYDLSPAADYILFVTKADLIEADLNSSNVKHRISLPRLKSNKALFNNIKYAPNGNLVYIRSIHECCTEGSEDAIVDLVNKKVQLLNSDFSDSVSLAPVWSPDSSKIFAWRPGKGLISYNLQTNIEEVTINENQFSGLGPFMENIDGNNFVYVTAKDLLNPSSSSSAKVYINPSLNLFDFSKSSSRVIIDSNTLNKRGVQGEINDAGWVSGNQIWFAVREQQNDRVWNIWTVSIDGSNMKKIIPSTAQYSPTSSTVPVTRSYTLFK